MTRDDLIAKLATQLEWEEENTTKALNALIDTLVNELVAGNRIDLDGFGMFRPERRAEYIYLDHLTNERYLMPPFIEVIFEEINAVTTDKPLHFLMDESLEKELNGSFALFEPTLLNEGVQFPDVDVISSVPESTAVVETSDTTSNAEREPVEREPVEREPIEREPKERELTPVDPSVKKDRRRGSRVWAPVIGGIALAVAAYFANRSR